MSLMVQSMYASAPSIIGLLLPECFQPISRNLSSALLANTRLTASWSSARTFTQKEPCAWIFGHEVEACPTQKRTCGGSSDRDVNDPMAMPEGLPSARPVITVTPVGTWPSTWRNLAESKVEPSSVMS